MRLAQAGVPTRFDNPFSGDKNNSVDNHELVIEMKLLERRLTLAANLAKTAHLM